METIWDSHLNEKLRILADAAKYDAACTSSGVDRKNGSMGTGNAVACGICHSFSADGRCISLLKILLTNDCCYDCVYCVNRVGNDTERATFSPDEVCTLTMGFYRRNYIEGLFLSSAVYRNPSYTMELIYETVLRLRTVYHFHGYIHVKAIPGADPQLIQQTGFLVDRMSCNLELPTAEGLRSLAPNKPRRQLLKPMRQIQQQITVSKHEVALYRHAQPFVPAGQSTQMIIGATGESDYQIMSVSEALYGRFKMKRVFYSAYVGVNEDSRLPAVGTLPPLLREHRLYQADWLIRFYGFKAAELLSKRQPNFNLLLDPKCDWAVRHLEAFPVEVMTADYYQLLRVPGLGVNSARRICRARRYGGLRFEDLKKMGVVLKRAMYFITCQGRVYMPFRMDERFITTNLLGLKERLPENVVRSGDTFRQLDLFDDFHLQMPVEQEDKRQVLTGQL
ncbi:putative DNA modification/repair radical SAM protein [Coprococcus sp. B2-R-112]|uniref:putative DNA modification/repair radical SAM protein n=1 Tax=Coprococcus sp. B2-R-112 TaxID=2949662 RepID=UPI002030D05F|nr:putative DNA modification/repair radical SAM protein [Coprococcus sp. B2-R-112]MCM0663854.1 putative DNA modification/repair radical SAM protein [Coprococcus sp. B2-R-112]